MESLSLHVTVAKLNQISFKSAKQSKKNVYTWTFAKLEACWYFCTQHRKRLKNISYVAWRATMGILLASATFVIIVFFISFVDFSNTFSSVLVFFFSSFVYLSFLRKIIYNLLKILSNVLAFLFFIFLLYYKYFLKKLWEKSFIYIFMTIFRNILRLL